jgi:O-antigen/teichoic acid export membrane protein
VAQRPRTTSPREERWGLRHLAGQSAILFAGFGTAQACSFLRNAMIGHWLSRGDFGIAASITLTLHLCETLLDLGVDRLIVQARDGNRPTLIAAAHSALLIRGALSSALLFVLAWPMTAMFGIPEACWAFQAIAIVPLLKGFLHLDMRRRQRDFDNMPFLIVEVAPQLISLAATIPLLWLTDSYAAVVWLAFLQSAALIVTSHLVATRTYRVRLSVPHLKRLWHFGWPIWLSALSLIAVYQGDRMIVGNRFGIEVLADYTVVFMITMVPSLIAAKVGHALMLPLLAQKRHDPAAFTERFICLTAVTAVLAVLYVASFAVVGELAVQIAFGSKYSGLGQLIVVFAIMWAIRMVQAVPGMALMAVGETRPLLIAGLIRASALGVALWAADNGYGVIGVAAAGIVGEAFTFTYVLWTTRRHCPIMPLPEAFRICGTNLCTRLTRYSASRTL